VLYSNGPWTIWSRGKESYRRSSLLGEFQECDNVTVDRPGRLLLRIPSLKSLDAAAIKAAARRWRRRLAPDNEPLVLWVFHPEFEPFVSHLDPRFLVYHPFDLFSQMPGWTAENSAAESRLLEHADLVISSSDAIRQDLEERSGRKVDVVANGVDYGRFAGASDQPVPPEMQVIGHPRIGYIGTINHKFDVDLMQALARRRPDWNFVFMGGAFGLGNDGQRSWEEIKQLPNVHYLGERPSAAVAAYTTALDVGLLCYRTSGTWTSGIYPLKLHEYLACGLPVISSDFPAAHQFPEVVWIASGTDGWEQSITRALAGVGPGTRDSRRAVASDNSWDRRVEQIEGLLQRMTRK
jgi:glycosyltransferase involved in cell wall biosynthesis